MPKGDATLFEHQADILSKSARACSIDGHISYGSYTAAERIMAWFEGKSERPHKNSFLYLDTVDVCFYIRGDKACCVFASRWFANSADLDKLADTGKLIKMMLTEMQKRVDVLLAPGRDNANLLSDIGE